MHYHIILTERCNLKCSYCYEKSMNEFENGLEKKWDYDMGTPVDSEVSIDRLKKLIKPDDSLIFYGGEPLVMMDKMKEIMDNLDCRFLIQTNAVLLNQLPTEYLLRLDKMLVSIDGTRERTDKNKGIGKYDLVLKNVRDARARGYTGEIVARMAITERDLFLQVKHLLDLELFDSIHWQIDAEFYKNDYDHEKFTQFVEGYNSSLTGFLNYWIDEIKSGSVLKLYPFLGVLARVIGWDKETRLPCGAGYANFTINTKGDLSSCPIMNSVKNMYCGSLEEGVKKEIHCGGWCVGCSYLDICGGRCLYSNDAQLWPKEGHDLVCLTIKKLINLVREKIPEIERLIDKGIVSPEDFDFERYFGPEIIP